jgi:glutathione peroxidase
MLKLSSILICLLSISFHGYSQTKKTSKESLYDIKIEGIDGKIIDLNLYKGKKILFVNVASECGFTNQYKGLQELYSKYKEKLVVIGLPCNQFNGQEPGSHRLYQWLTMKVKNGKKNSSVKWNFQKYLINEKGQLIDVFYSFTKPMSKKITKLI